MNLLSAILCAVIACGLAACTTTGGDGAAGIPALEGTTPPDPQGSQSAAATPRTGGTVASAGVDPTSGQTLFLWEGGQRPGEHPVHREHRRVCR